eukprot:TRINITY_DN6004_c0_g1_i1.p1 TRINITY_DN6004_c0_g1~~TRINITY_DN6004_c0_g1_i1.p1  ORF type:complete len:988 (+),score=190.01 TRINITY_DN6004_c0_g1_i1:193-2964(+)
MATQIAAQMGAGALELRHEQGSGNRANRSNWWIEAYPGTPGYVAPREPKESVCTSGHDVTRDQCLSKGKCMFLELETHNLCLPCEWAGNPIPCEPAGTYYGDQGVVKSCDMTCPHQHLITRVSLCTDLSGNINLEDCYAKGLSAGVKCMWTSYSNPSTGVRKTMCGPCLVNGIGTVDPYIGGTIGPEPGTLVDACFSQCQDAELGLDKPCFDPAVDCPDRKNVIDPSKPQLVPLEGLQGVGDINYTLDAPKYWAAKVPAPYGRKQYEDAGKVAAEAAGWRIENKTRGDPTWDKVAAHRAGWNFDGKTWYKTWDKVHRAAPTPKEGPFLPEDLQRSGPSGHKIQNWAKVHLGAGAGQVDYSDQRVWENGVQKLLGRVPVDNDLVQAKNGKWMTLKELKSTLQSTEENDLPEVLSSIFPIQVHAGTPLGKVDYRSWLEDVKEKLGRVPEANDTVSASNGEVMTLQDLNSTGEALPNLFPIQVSKDVGSVEYPRWFEDIQEKLGRIPGANDRFKAKDGTFKTFKDLLSTSKEDALKVFPIQVSAGVSSVDYPLFKDIQEKLGRVPEANDLVQVKDGKWMTFEDLISTKEADLPNLFPIQVHEEVAPLGKVDYQVDYSNQRMWLKDVQKKLGRVPEANDLVRTSNGEVMTLQDLNSTGEALPKLFPIQVSRDMGQKSRDVQALPGVLLPDYTFPDVIREPGKGVINPVIVWPSLIQQSSGKVEAKAQGQSGRSMLQQPPLFPRLSPTAAAAAAAAAATTSQSLAATAAAPQLQPQVDPQETDRLEADAAEAEGAGVPLQQLQESRVFPDAAAAAAIPEGASVAQLPMQGTATFPAAEALPQSYMGGPAGQQHVVEEPQVSDVSGIPESAPVMQSSPEIDSLPADAAGGPPMPELPGSSDFASVPLPLIQQTGTLQAPPALRGSVVVQ